MTVTIRRFAACPERTSTQTWDEITTTICDKDETAKKEFKKVVGGLSSIISDEIPASSPIVVRGSGPLLRIYCQYGEDAVLGTDNSEDELSWNIFATDWKVYVPCKKEELDLMKRAVENKSEYFEVYDESKKLTFTEKDRTLSESNINFDVDLLRNL